MIKRLSYLRVTILWESERHVVEEQLETFLEIIVAQVFERSPGHAPARRGVLYAGRVNNEDGVGRLAVARRDGPERNTKTTFCTQLARSPPRTCVYLFFWEELRAGCDTASSTPQSCKYFFQN
jgi:hypothetical protein